MKLRTALVAALGIGFLAWLVWRTGLRPVLSSITAIGVGGFLIVLAFQLGLAVPTGWAWFLIGGGPSAPKPRLFVWARMVREAASQLLPFTHIGGLALGGRALSLGGVPGASAFASTFADTTLEFTTQVAYVALSALLLVQLRPGNPFGRPLLMAILALAAMAAALLAVRSRGLPLLSRWVKRGPVHAFIARIAESDGGAFGAHPVSTAGAALLHFVAWVLSGVQTWLILRLLHMDVSLGAALVMDSLTSGARSVAFLVPSGLGVQEAALVGLGEMFGVPPPAALALSLIRRGRDLVLAAPVLLIWQLRHGERIWRLGRERP